MNRNNYLLIALSLSALIAIYILQRFSFANALNAFLPQSIEMNNPFTIFIVNKTTRLILNDLACMLLIYALFREKKFVRGAFYLFLVELLIVLPVYFVIKLNTEGVSELSSPLLSQIHRLIVNPLLMILLMLGFVFQRLKSEKY